MDNPIIASLEVTLHNQTVVSTKSVGNLKILYKGDREIIVGILLKAMQTDPEFAGLLKSTVHEFDNNNQ